MVECTLLVLEAVLVVLLLFNLVSIWWVDRQRTELFRRIFEQSMSNIRRDIEKLQEEQRRWEQSD